MSMFITTETYGGKGISSSSHMNYDGKPFSSIEAAIRNAEEMFEDEYVDDESTVYVCELVPVKIVRKSKSPIITEDYKAPSPRKIKTKTASVKIKRQRRSRSTV